MAVVQAPEVSEGGPGLLHLTATQGATLKRSMTYSLKDPVTGVKTPVDITGWTATMTVKSMQGSTAALVTLTSGAGIVLGGAAGTIDMTVSDDVMATLTQGRYAWDLWMYPPNGESICLLAGELRIRDAVTGA
jgi:hypothetical protein